MMKWTLPPLNARMVAVHKWHHFVLQHQWKKNRRMVRHPGRGVESLQKNLGLDTSLTRQSNNNHHGRIVTPQQNTCRGRSLFVEGICCSLEVPGVRSASILLRGWCAADWPRKCFKKYGVFAHTIRKDGRIVLHVQSKKQRMAITILAGYTYIHVLVVLPNHHHRHHLFKKHFC